MSLGLSCVFLAPAEALVVNTATFTNVVICNNEKILEPNVRKALNETGEVQLVALKKIKKILDGSEQGCVKYLHLSVNLDSTKIFLTEINKSAEMYVVATLHNLQTKEKVYAMEFQHLDLLYVRARIGWIPI
jgi:hypothetical protein